MNPDGVDLLQLTEFYDLGAILAVAETGSFRRASTNLEISQSAVTRRIQKIEDALGVSLFERHPGGAKLTRAGWSFSERVRSILDDYRAAIDAAQSAGSGAEGRLDLGLIASLSAGVLRDVVAAFAARHQDVDVTFVETERSELLTLLSHRRLDVVMASGEFPETHGDSTLLVEEPIYVALREDDPLARHVHLSWDNVKEARFLVSATEPGPEIHEYLIRRLADLGHHPNIARHRLGREGIMNLVGLGFGLSLVAEHWCGVSYPGVAFRPVGEPGERVPFSIVWRPENDNPALRRFLSLARIEARRHAAPSEPSRSPDPSP